MDNPEELLEFPDGSTFSEAGDVLKAVNSLRSDLKSFMEAFQKKKPKEEEEPDKYKYPKKMQEWMENPAEFEAFETKLAEDTTAFETKIAELEAKVKEFETTETGEKIDQLLTAQEEKGLINSEMKEQLHKDYSEKFSIEQIDTLLGNIEKMDFSKAKGGAKKGVEPKTKETKDFSERRTEVKAQLAMFEDAGVKGPGYDAYTKELESLDERLN